MKKPQPPITIHSAQTPSKPHKPTRFIVLGGGSRGTAYAQAVTTSTTGRIHAVAEPHAFKRWEFGRRFVWGAEFKAGVGQEFGDWREWMGYEVKRRSRMNGDSREGEGEEGEDVGVDGVFICTLDDQHVEILHALAHFKDLHILCEKPLALSLSDCLSVYRTLSPSPETAARQTIFSIGHVLRYNPHNILLRKLLRVDGVIGKVVSLEHTEPVGWWHFSHSYVRGNWRRETGMGDGSLLTKSCHDLDFILWLLCSPVETPTSSTTAIETGIGDSNGYGYHHPRTISSTGTLSQFTYANKPPNAGTATNCLSCPASSECNYSALKIYHDMHLSRGIRDWPVNIICPDIEDTYRIGGPEAAENDLLSKLAEDYDIQSTPDEDIAKRPWYGRCVYEADNSVCDDQIVTITWDASPSPTPSSSPNTRDSGTRGSRKTALFHMIAPTEKQCQRRGRIYGTTGELTYDSRTITIHDFTTAQTNTIEVPKQPPEEEKAHGGGDYGLARGFVEAVEAVVNEGWRVEEAQARFVGCTLEEAVRSHAVVFAAEEARREEKVVKWKEWWGEKLVSVGLSA